MKSYLQKSFYKKLAPLLGVLVLVLLILILYNNSKIVQSHNSLLLLPILIGSTFYGWGISYQEENHIEISVPKKLKHLNREPTKPNNNLRKIRSVITKLKRKYPKDKRISFLLEAVNSLTNNFKTNNKIY